MITLPQSDVLACQMAKHRSHIPHMAPTRHVMSYLHDGATCLGGVCMLHR